MKKITLSCIVLLLASSGAPAADFDGDGTGDVAIFRGGNGLWAVRRMTRFYFGIAGDAPVPGDYAGNGTDLAAIFRAGSGFWSVRGLTQIYFGSSDDQAVPGDYNADGKFDVGIFRPAAGLWAVRNLTRMYLGSTGDLGIEPGATAPQCRLPVTGQVFQYHAGDDGDWQAGAPFNFQTRSIMGDLVVYHPATGLMWAADGAMEGCNWGELTDWEAALDYCNQLYFASYDDWRLPNAKELQSIADFGYRNPALDLTYFPETIPDYFWTSTSLNLETDKAWVIDFSTGDLFPQDKGVGCQIRAVRGGN